MKRFEMTTVIMKDYDVVAEIIENVMTDEDFEKIHDAEVEYWGSIDTRVSQNARKKAIYNLKKYGLTFDEYLLYVAD